MNEQKEKTTLKKGGLGCLVVLVIFVSVVVIFSSLFGGSDDVAKPEHDKAAAWTMMEKFVTEQLKSPSTAKFPWINDDMIEDLGDGRYTITAYVDSQNSFGAMIRTDFICTVKYAGEDRWQLESLEFKD